MERAFGFMRWIARTVVMSAVVAAWGQQTPQAPITMEGPTMGAVRFSHWTHTHIAGKCGLCHHASKPEKPMKGSQQACLDCHTKPPTPPVRVGLPNAFHNAGATSGLCITCHKTENAEGRAAPVKCADCHKKENS